MKFLFVFLLSLTIYANKETAAGRNEPNTKFSVGSNSAAVELSSCKPQEDTTTKTEEAFARKEAEKAGFSKEETLARLIYSESLSTGYWNKKCSANSDSDIMLGIGWGIMNRIKAKAKSTLDAYSDVVFGKSQFRTSFSGKKENPFAAAFLCPLKSQTYLNQAGQKVSAADLYKKAQSTAQKIVADYESNGIPEKYRGITNFFYPQSEFFGEMRPSWAKDVEAKKNPGYMNLLNVDSKPCVEFYKLK